MYQPPRQADQNVTTPAAELLADKTGQQFQALQNSLTRARQAAQAPAGTPVEGHAARGVSKRLDTAFDVAQMILDKARIAQAQRT